MDLKDFINENSISNLDWIDDGDDTYEPKDKDIDKKDDLEIEWGEGSGVDIGYQPNPTTIKDEMDLTNNYMQRTVREMQMAGMDQDSIVSSLVEKFGKSLVKNNMSDIKASLSQLGFIGCVALDARGCEQCKDVIKIASKSPFKRYIKFVVANEGCADCMFFKRNKIARVTKKASNNSVDGFLNGDEVSDGEARPVCMSLGLPVILSQSDVTENDAVDTINKLFNEEGLSKEDASSIISSDLTPFEKIKVSFLKIMDSKNKTEKVGVDKNNEQVKYGYKENIEVNERLVANDVVVGSSATETISGVEVNGDMSVDVEDEKKNSQLDVDITPDMKI